MISIEPECPSEITAGQTGGLKANEEDPGAIPTYLWEAFPSTAVDIDDPASPDTTFEALADGEVEFRLTAGDGLFLVQQSCRTRINAPSPLVTVEMTAGPQAIEAGGSVLLTCQSTGESPAVTFAIDQVEGVSTDLTDVAPGSAVAVIETAGEAVFRCIGTDADGNVSEPFLVTVTVARPSRSDGGVR